MMASRLPSTRFRLLVAATVLLGWTAPTIANTNALFGYDANGRLTTALYDNGLCVVYDYDVNGNRTSQSSLTAPTAPVWGSARWGCFSWTAP